MITSSNSFTAASSFRRRISSGHRQGFVLPLVFFALIILMALIIGTTMTDYHTRLQAVQTKSQTEAMLAAEAGYERAIFWMSQQSDILSAIQAGSDSGTIVFPTSTCSYEIDFHGFLGARPVFRIVSTGTSGRPSFTKIVDVDVIQETSGWAMGACRIPNGTSSTIGVNFVDNEIIDIPLHINKAADTPDRGDIFISGNPTFIKPVEMGESRKIGTTDKNVYTQNSNGSLSLRGTYGAVMPRFNSGITFDQPNVRITDETAVQSKVNRFRDSTAAAFRFTPAAADTNVPSPRDSAVQLEFYVSGGIGRVRITNNCTVKTNSGGDYDYKVTPGTAGSTFQKYNTYAYHFAPSATNPYRSVTDVTVASTYVTQTFGGYTSEPGGQIYVNGNVVIGSSDYTDMIVKDKITVVATGNIWIADSIKVDDNGGTQRDANGMPSVNNPNVLGLIAQGVIKVVNPTSSSPSSPTARLVYQPIGITKSGYSGRFLPDPTVVEAALTVGGGGWGAEGVYNPGRREYSSPQDGLIVRGSITEVIRGVVGVSGSSADGYIKNYYIDTRLMSGILPGDIWFSGKYIPAPAGWHDHSPN